MNNLKGNWFIPVSGMLFVCSSLRRITLSSLVCVPVSFLTLLVIALLTESVIPHVKNDRTGHKLFWLLTTIGIGLSNYDCCSRKWVASPKLAGLLGRLPFGDSAWAAPALYICLLVLGLPFVYVCLTIFGQKLRAVTAKHRIFSDISKTERIVYALLLAVIFSLTTAVFLDTNAFSVPDPNYNVIYTSDSPFLVKNNVYTHLFHLENDLRQPLFAIFAAPFTGAAYLLGRLLPAFGTPAGLLPALFTNFAQIVMLIAACFMMSRLLRLSAAGRMGFCLLFVSTYTFILAPLMMEQYVVAFFWLMLAALCTVEGKAADADEVDDMVLIGAAGTLLTSVLCTPLASRRSPLREFRQWFGSMLRTAGGFVLCVLAFGRVDVLFGLTAAFGGFSRYDGEALTLSGKLMQYSVFLKNVFVRPEAAVSMGEFPSWQLLPAETFSIFGIIVFLLAALSVVLNRDKPAVVLSGCWAAFSLVVLVVLGWGTAENGLILYSLYFGWAFFVLLFALMQKLCEALDKPGLLPVLCAVGIVTLWVFNVPAIRELIDFAKTYYPI
ncbi:MAG: hypothetical protein E7559_02110 [Ruminococcaceae bacterium]|nr:hypothetical protein [Oscillospiraceae bacterium]